MTMQHGLSSLLLGGLAFATLAAAPSASAQRPDSAATRAVLAPTRQQALTQQLLRLRAEIESLRSELARSGSAESQGTRARRTTIESLVQSQRFLEQAIREHSLSVQAREAEERASVMTFRARAAAAQPTGWVGLTTENRYTVSEGGGGRAVRLSEPPVIVSVTPGSPAFRAGLAAGDTVVSINQRDGRIVAQELSSMLRPGDTLYFRIRRSDGTRVIPVRVEQRAVMGTFSASTAQGEGGVGGAATGAVSGSYVVSTRPAPGAGGIIVSTTPGAAETRAAGTGTVVAGPVGSGGGRATVYYIRQPGLAGARIEPLPRDLASKFGVEQGLYVLSVAPETPSARAGLRAGDVIIGTGGNALASLAQLQQALQSSSARALELEVMRDQERTKVTLRW